MASERLPDRPAPVVGSDRRAGTDEMTEPEIVYVSWGGTGRAATFRRALALADETGRGLVYLAILDNGTFGDIDQAMLELARDELAWLLDAQLELTRKQIGARDVAVRVLVRAGDVADEIAAEVDATGATEVLIGAPIPATERNAVSDLVELLGTRIGASITVIEP